MKRARPVVASLAGALLALGIATGQAFAAPSGPPIRIGSTLSLTGPLSGTAIIHKLVGEIYEEHDQRPTGAPAPGGSTLAELDGATPTADVAARFAVALPARGASTIGGLLAELAGRIPAAGERFVIGGLEIDVVTATATRVERVLVRPGPVALVPLVRESA